MQLAKKKIKKNPNQTIKQNKTQLISQKICLFLFFQMSLSLKKMFITCFSHKKQNTTNQNQQNQIEK